MVNKKSEAVMGSTIAQMFEQFMRKSAKINLGFELDPRDRSVLL